LTPETWDSLVEILLTPLSWIPKMQEELFYFFAVSSSPWIAAAKFLLLFFPVLLWIGAIWCSHLSLYTLPFRSNRLKFIAELLVAWWDAARAVWLYWVGLARLLAVVAGWIINLGRLALRLVAEAVKQILIAPITMTGNMTRSYFQPGVPWIAFVMLLFWCALEATIFTYTLYPTVSEVLADLVGMEPRPMTGTVLFLFLLLLIMGSFACIQALLDAVQSKRYKFIVQMVLVELFVMFFEVMFLYRELVDAITPWIAQQTGEAFQLGIGFTLSVATFGWIGIRGMTWFLFGQFGTPPLLAFISREPLQRAEAAPAQAAPPEREKWWEAPIRDFKREVDWLHDKSREILEYLSLPVLHVIASLLNFAMILVLARPVFRLPFKNLEEVMGTREIRAELVIHGRKVQP
jgi:hypothetical protein